MMTEGRACLMKNLPEAQSLLQAEVDKNPQNEKLTKMLEEVKQLRKLGQVKNGTLFFCWQMLMQGYTVPAEGSTNRMQVLVLKRCSKEGLLRNWVACKHLLSSNWKPLKRRHFFSNEDQHLNVVLWISIVGELWIFWFSFICCQLQRLRPLSYCGPSMLKSRLKKL